MAATNCLKVSTGLTVFSPETRPRRAEGPRSSAVSALVLSFSLLLRAYLRVSASPRQKSLSRVSQPIPPRRRRHPHFQLSFSPDFNNLKLWNSGILPAPMLYLELESVLTRTPPNPPGPSGFQSFLPIARRGVPFTSIDGRAFMTVPAQSSGYRTLPIRSRAFRQWFFDQSLSDYETIPTACAFSAILHYLEAQAARDPGTCKIRVPYRIDSRGFSPTPERILLDLANSHGQFVDRKST